MTAAIAVSLLLPVCLWLALVIVMAGKRWEMDFGPDRGSFFAPYALYRRQAYVVFASGAIGSLCASLLRNPRAEEAVVLLAAAALYAFVFNIWVPYAYESYLHSKYPKNLPGAVRWQAQQDTMQTITRPEDIRYIGPSNYTAPKYATTMALGLSSSVLFVAGFVNLVYALSNR